MNGGVTGQRRRWWACGPLLLLVLAAHPASSSAAPEERAHAYYVAAESSQAGARVSFALKDGDLESALVNREIRCEGKKGSHRSVNFVISFGPTEIDKGAFVSRRQQRRTQARFLLAGRMVDAGSSIEGRSRLRAAIQSPSGVPGPLACDSGRIAYRAKRVPRRVWLDYNESFGVTPGP